MKCLCPACTKDSVKHICVQGPQVEIPANIFLTVLTYKGNNTNNTNVNATLAFIPQLVTEYLLVPDIVQDAWDVGVNQRFLPLGDSTFITS